VVVTIKKYFQDLKSNQRKSQTAQNLTSNSEDNLLNASRITEDTDNALDYSESTNHLDKSGPKQAKLEVHRTCTEDFINHKLARYAIVSQNHTSNSEDNLLNASRITEDTDNVLDYSESTNQLDKSGPKQAKLEVHRTCTEDFINLKLARYEIDRFSGQQKSSRCTESEPNSQNMIEMKTMG
jgi:hypothetical protein